MTTPRGLFKLQVILFGFLCGALIATMILARRVRAQETDVQPYIVYYVKNPGGAHDYRLYKQVYQGCEVFVAVSMWHGDIAMMPGRGCR